MENLCDDFLVRYMLRLRLRLRPEVVEQLRLRPEAKKLPPVQLYSKVIYCTVAGENYSEWKKWEGEKVQPGEDLMEKSGI